jgi:hypothetical protein
VLGKPRRQNVRAHRAPRRVRAAFSIKQIIDCRNADGIRVFLLSRFCHKIFRALDDVVLRAQMRSQSMLHTPDGVAKFFLHMHRFLRFATSNRTRIERITCERFAVSAARSTSRKPLHSPK